jgi:23S rRNA (uracil1939-C5)-methyltransferase
MNCHIKVGDIVEATIHTVAFGGDGIGRIDNMVVFVPFTVDGDVVDVEIKKIRKNYLRGKIKSILLPSPKRTDPRCLYYSRCGGCQYQHISYEHQLRIKERQVMESFERIGKIVSPPMKTIIPSPRTFNYRGKTEYHLNLSDMKHPRTGLMDIEGGVLLDIERCEIADESINRAYHRFRKDLISGNNIFEGDRRTFWSESGGDEKCETENDLIEFKSVWRTVKGKSLRVPHEGFFQANTFLTDILVEYVINMGALTYSDVALDCYCGSGLFSLFLSPHVRQIYGIEMDRNAVHCARVNFRNYNVTNTQVFEGRVEKILKKDCLKEKSIDIVLLDPPRIGCTKEVLDRVIEMKPIRVIYVSCNPATQARDIRYLNDRGFSLGELQPVDMFPQTKHIEVIASLNRSEHSNSV